MRTWGIIVDRIIKICIIKIVDNLYFTTYQFDKEQFGTGKHMIKVANSRFIVRKAIKTTILVFCAGIFIMGVFLANRMFIVIMTMAMSVTVAAVTLFHNHLFLSYKKNSSKSYRSNRSLHYVCLYTFGSSVCCCDFIVHA